MNGTPRRPPKKLVLAKETLRALGREQLAAVGGASGEDCVSFRICFSRELPCFPIVI